MGYRLRVNAFSTPTTIDRVLLLLFFATVFVATPYCLLKLMNGAHDFWRIVPPIGPER
jgi:hypothetical protein